MITTDYSESLLKARRAMAQAEYFASLMIYATASDCLGDAMTHLAEAKAHFRVLHNERKATYER